MQSQWALQWAALAGLALYLLVLGIQRWLPPAPFRRLRRYVRVFFFMSLSMLIVKECGWSMYWIPSTSMSPTLVVGDVLLVNRHAYTLRDPVVSRLVWVHSLPRHGDIVVFHAPHQSDNMFIKRVVGLPGDTIATLDKQWYRNGVRIPHRPLSEVEDRRAGDAFGQPTWQEGEDPGYRVTFLPPDPAAPEVSSWVVPPGHVFVLGDNRDRSEDSRSWGMLPLNTLVGKAERVLWNLSDPPSEQGVLAASSTEVANEPAAR